MRLSGKHYKFMIFLAISSMLAAIAIVCQPIILQDTINSLVNGEKRLVFFLTLYVGSVILILVFELLRKWITAKYEAELENWFRSRMEKNLLARNPAAFHEHSPQEYISVINNDMPSVVKEYYLEWNEIVFQLIMIIFSGMALTGIYFPLAIISVATSLIIVCLPFCFKPLLQKKREESLESMKAYNNKLSDLVFGYSEIRLNQMGTAIRQIVRLASDKNVKKEEAFSKTRAFSDIVIGLVSFAGSFLVIAIGGYQVYRGSMDLGSLFAAIQLSDLLASPVIGISDSLNSVVAANKIRNNLTEYCAEPEERGEKIRLQQPIKTIALEHINLSYENKQIMKDVSLSFERNKKYLIIGKNGSGKSTLIHLIAGDLDTKAATVDGRVLINGVDRGLIDEENLFRQLAVVSQTPYIFKGTVQNNIFLFQEPKPEEATALLDGLQEEDMKRLLESTRALSDENEKISGGEKQKIAMLRALLKKPGWLILDESTAAMDRRSKEAVNRYICSRKDLTVIHISHDYNEDMMANYDKVIDIEEICGQDRENY